MSVTEQDIKQGRLNDELSSQLESISARVEANIENGRNAWAEWKARTREQCMNALSASNEYARERPWQVAGVALLAGMVAGLLCGRR